METITKPALSVSGLNMHETCGEAWRRRYIEKESIPPGIAAHQGSGTHKGAETALQHKLDHDGALPPLEKVHAAARDTFQKRYQNEGVLWTPEERKEGIKAVKGRAIDAMITLTTAYHEEYAPVLVPVPGRIEWKWRLEPGLPMDLRGVVDVQTYMDEAKTIVRPRDLKTSKKTPPAHAADTSSQLRLYALAQKQFDGASPDKAGLDYLVNLKGGVKAMTIWTDIHESDYDPLLERINTTMESIQAGVFVPAPPDSWKCSQAWCGYFPTCRFAYRPVSVQVPK